MFFLGITEYAHTDVDLAGAERSFPVLRMVNALVAKLLGARGHAHTECLRETLQRTLRKTERLKSRIADPDCYPGIGSNSPACSGID